MRTGGWNRDVRRPSCYGAGDCLGNARGIPIWTCHDLVPRPDPAGTARRLAPPARAFRKAVADRPVARRTGGSAHGPGGVPERQARMRAQPALALALSARRHRFFRHDQHVEGAARDARPAFRAGAAGNRRRAGVERRHAQMAVPLSAARRRPAGRDGDGLHSRGGPRHALRLLPGRLHAHLHLLPYRHAEAGAQPDGGGDRRADPRRARPARRFSRPRHAARRHRAGGRPARSPTS